MTIVNKYDIINKNVIIHFIYGTALVDILVDIFSSYTDEIHKMRTCISKEFDFGMTYEFRIHKFVFRDNYVMNMVTYSKESEFKCHSCA